MTKAQLVDALAAKVKVDKKAAAAALDGLTALIHGTLRRGGDVKLQGLGRFRVVKRKARMGRNPATGEPIKIPTKTVVRFSVAKSLRDMVKR